MSTFTYLVRRRRSTRKFLTDKPVPQELLQESLELAMRAPSNSNVQPWRVYLATGARRDKLAAALSTAARTDPPANLGLPDSFAPLRRELGALVYGSMGVARDDVDARWTAQLRNFEFFGAPHVAVVHTDRALGVYGAVDCGGYVTALLLAARACGVDSVAMASIAMYSDLVRRHLDLGEDRQVVCAVGLGLADEGHPANAFRTSRAAPDEVVETRA